MNSDHLAPDSRMLPNSEASGVRGCELCGLDAMACGQAARVVRLQGAPRIVRRLIALGMRPSTECQILGRAPHGGPIHLRAGSVHLMVRASEAAGIVVEPRGEASESRHLLPVL